MRTLLYHATYASNIPSIVKHGLDASKKVRDNYDMQDEKTSKWLFFDLTDNGAVAFAENADFDSVEDEDIVLLAVDIGYLDTELLRLDPYNAIPITLAYDGVIKPENISVVHSERTETESLLFVKDFIMSDSEDRDEWIQQ